MRLDKLLGQAGFGSRNQVKKLIRSRQVYVDGRLAEADNLNVEPSLQEITVSGKQVTLSTEKYFILNKPAGVVSAVSDKEHQTVIDLIAESDRVPKLYPVGRLDRDTEGLLLITNNGPLGYRMLHPKYHVTKTYYVEVNGRLADDAPAFFENGVTFSSSEKSSAYITIAEGKFHQVKKMFLAYGVKVTYLKRMTFGEFELGDLPTGNYRELTINEKEILKNYLD